MPREKVRSRDDCSRCEEDLGEPKRGKLQSLNRSRWKSG